MILASTRTNSTQTSTGTQFHVTAAAGVPWRRTQELFAFPRVQQQSPWQFVLVSRSEWTTDLGEPGKAKTTLPWTTPSTFIEKNNQNHPSGDAFHFQRQGKLFFGGFSVAVNPCTLLNRTQLTAEILFLKKYQAAAFQFFSKILLFLYETNCWSLD